MHVLKAYQNCDMNKQCSSTSVTQTKAKYLNYILYFVDYN